MSPDSDSVGPTAEFAEAWQHIEDAKRTRSELAQIWTELCGSEAFSSYTSLRDDRSGGSIWVEVSWPSELRRRAEASALQFGQSIIGAFSSALHRVAELTSGVIISLRMEDYRMPILQSAAEFERHSRRNFQGVRPDHVEMVRFFQPFTRAEAPGEFSQEIARSMTQLGGLIGVEEVEPGSANRVAVWMHSASPEVRTDPPRSIQDISWEQDCYLRDAVELARFAIVDAEPDDQITTNPNVAFDLALDVSPEPVNPDDNFASRSALLVALASEFIRGCERSVGLRAPLDEGARDQFTIQLDDSEPTWAPLEIPDSILRDQVQEAMAGSDIGLAVYRDDDGNMMLLVKGAGGSEIFGRTVAPASGLDLTRGRGEAAEDATLKSAEIWGLPDFVLYPEKVSEASRNREIGDGTIVVGQRGLAIQVKSRDAPGADPDRERTWIKKRVAKAARQASGTIRTITRVGASLKNGRGRSISLAGESIDWTRVVVIDHDSPPNGVTPEFDSVDPPVVAILRRDWDFLFDQLRSVSAVTDYLHRVAREEACELGDEPVRYFELADADELSTGGASPEWMDGLEGQHFSHPLLPKAPVSSADEAGHAIFRVLLDDIALSQFGGAEEDRLRILSLIDRFSVGYRSELGRLLMAHLEDASSAESGTTLWKFRWVVQDGGLLQLGFGACSEFTDLHREAFRQRTIVRHHDFVEAGNVAKSEKWTVALILTPRRNDGRRWDTTLFAMNGSTGMSEEDLAPMRALWSREAN
ncbi:hypothetical protein [Pseudonocardia acidicola]|uniref:AIPR protein n=1 Tax=Pseudonocardia acidicola TaxID=2724939 RepID=A0ABX1SKR9_9PSEU|nr:hypothetical protein [Pseudonocardia acidicola]NMI00865.1 hypothetical protein [Pseudonocardia acidicola]